MLLGDVVVLAVVGLNEVIFVVEDVVVEVVEVFDVEIFVCAVGILVVVRTVGILGTNAFE